MKFAEFFQKNVIVSPVATRLSWSHFIELLPIKQNKARMFYVQKAAENLWNKRELRHQIERKAYERSELANIKFASSDIELQNTFKSPYFFDFSRPEKRR